MKIILSSCLALVLILPSVAIRADFLDFICSHYPHLDACQPPPTPPAGMVLYDDFNTKPLDPDRWFGTESTPFLPGDPFIGEPGVILESSRKITFKKLKLAARGYGNTVSDVGTSAVSTKLVFSSLRDITGFAATVRVKKADVSACGGNNGRVRIRLSGYFFNTGPLILGSHVNDVLAILAMERRAGSSDPPGILQLSARLFLCTDAPCLGGMTLDSVLMGTVSVGERVQLRLQWDPDNNLFIFQRDDEPELRLSYAVSDAMPPDIADKRLEVALRPANCASTPRPPVFGKATFDDVFVNETVTP